MNNVSNAACTLVLCVSLRPVSRPPLCMHYMRTFSLHRKSPAGSWLLGRRNKKGQELTVDVVVCRQLTARSLSMNDEQVGLPSSGMRFDYIHNNHLLVHKSAILRIQWTNRGDCAGKCLANSYLSLLQTDTDEMMCSASWIQILI